MHLPNLVWYKVISNGVLLIWIKSFASKSSCLTTFSQLFTYFWGTETLHYEPWVTQGHFWSIVQLVWSQSFPSPRTMVLSTLKNQSAFLFSDRWGTYTLLHQNTLIIPFIISIVPTSYPLSSSNPSLYSSSS